MTVIGTPAGAVEANADSPREPDRFDQIAIRVAELHVEIQEMRRELRRLGNQLLTGLVDLAKE